MLISFVCQLIVEIDLLRLICNWKLQEVEGVEELALCNLVCFWAAFWNFYNSFVQGGYFHLKYSFIEIYIQRSKANHLFLIFCACLIYIISKWNQSYFTTSIRQTIIVLLFSYSKICSHWKWDTCKVEFEIMLWTEPECCPLTFQARR